MSNYIEFLKSEKLFDSMSIDEIAMQLVVEYMGTCYPISEDDQLWLEENLMEDYFYEDMFLCDGCGWYYEVSEMQENSECEDCND